MTNKVNICLYHGIDLDGFCGGAIYAEYMQERDEPFEMIPANYGWALDWEKFDGAEITLIDFSIQPYEDFMALLERASKVVWIDHHKSAIDECLSRPMPVELDRKLTRVLDVRKAGCELAWEYFRPNERMPLAVRLLGRYDVWDHSDELTLPFQYGMRLYDMDPSNGDDRRLWSNLLDQYLSPDAVHPRTTEGATVLRYQTREDEIGAKTCFTLDWEGLRWIAANRGGRGSKFFDSVWDEEKYDGMMGFSWNGATWTFGLYSTKPEIDCGAIAKRHGGGGHPGAAGFRTDALPFELADTTKLPPTSIDTKE